MSLYTLQWHQAARPVSFRCAACARACTLDAYWSVDGGKVCDACLDGRYGSLLKCRTPGCQRFGDACDLVRGRCDLCRQVGDPDAAACAIDEVGAQAGDERPASADLEIGTEENAILVQEVCDAVAADLAAGRPVAAWRQAILDVDRLVMEVNSGASFEQYFRWATTSELARIVSSLQQAGLPQVAELAATAAAIAFPQGVPDTPAALDHATQWSPAQEHALAAFFPPLEDLNGHITNALAAFARRHLAGEAGEHPHA